MIRDIVMQRAGRVVGAAMILGLALVPRAAAQNVTKQSCGGKDPVGYIGISGIDCDCTISPPGSSRPWVFRSEPKVTSLEMDSPAGRLLKTGDVITHVNGKLITTPEGAQALAALQAGESLVLTIRRDGLSQTYAMTPAAACPADSRLFSVYAPGVPGGRAPKVAPSTRAPGSTPAPSGGSGVARAPRAPYAIAPRATFGMGISCSGHCSIKVSEQNNTTFMLFSQPPEVYSIERDGPADKAGIRRGDVLTHIDGKPVDSAEGGRLFANVKPGQVVKFTVTRGGERKVLSVTAAARVTPAPQLAKSSESLERARASLSRLQQEQAEQVRRLQDELRKSQREEEAAVRELRKSMLDQERQHRQRLSELANELARAESRMRAALADSARAACQVPGTSLLGSARSSRTLRYTGTIGDVDIEVRGADRTVSVTEAGDEIEIATGGTTVKLKSAKKK